MPASNRQKSIYCFVNKMQNDDNRTARQRRHDETVRITLIGAVVDFLLAIVKIVVGFVAHSQSLIADGIHSLSDLVTDAVVLFAARHAHMDADEDHPYGHGRFETLATVALGLALMGLAVGIILDAGYRLAEGEPHALPGAAALVVAALSVLSKEILYRYTVFVADRHGSPMLKANAWHHRSDALSSVVVLFGVGGAMAGYWYLDGIAAIGVGLMIAKIGWELAWNAVRELVDTALEPDRVEAIRRAILETDGVVSLHILRSRRMGGEALVDVHIQVSPTISVSEGHYVSETVRRRVIAEIDEVTDVMVHIDPEDDEAVPSPPDLPLRSELLERLHQRWRDIDAARHIADVTLHYLEGRIQVILHLPVTLLEQASAEELARQFSEAAEAEKSVSHVRLCFQ